LLNVLTRTQHFDHITPVLAFMLRPGLISRFTVNLQRIAWTCSYLCLWLDPAIHTYMYTTVTRPRPPYCPSNFEGNSWRDPLLWDGLQIRVREAGLVSTFKS
jgi:hypothetical protein